MIVKGYDFSNLRHYLKSCKVGEVVYLSSSGDVLTVLEHGLFYVTCSVLGKQGQFAYNKNLKINRLK